MTGSGVRVAGGATVSGAIGPLISDSVPHVPVFEPPPRPVPIWNFQPTSGWQLGCSGSSTNGEIGCPDWYGLTPGPRSCRVSWRLLRARLGRMSAKVGQ